MSRFGAGRGLFFDKRQLMVAATAGGKGYQRTYEYSRSKENKKFRPQFVFHRFLLIISRMTDATL